VLAARDLQAAGVESFNLGDGVHLLSDERRPLFLAWPKSSAANRRRNCDRRRRISTDARALVAGAAAARPPPRCALVAGARAGAAIFVPCLGDLDQDGKTDLVWTDTGGMLQIKLAAQRAGVRSQGSATPRRCKRSSPRARGRRSGSPTRSAPANRTACIAPS
jgi:hypothetical protein